MYSVDIQADYEPSTTVCFHHLENAIAYAEQYISEHTYDTGIKGFGKDKNETLKYEWTPLDIGERSWRCEDFATEITIWQITFLDLP